LRYVDWKHLNVLRLTDPFQQSREPQHSDICKEMSSLEPAVNLTQDLPATPASTQQFMDEAAQRGHPVSATRDEQCLKDVKIFHPDPESAVTISTIAKIDTGSDHSHITPKTLQLLGIPLDSELIQPVDYEYSTLGGPVVARGSITLSWRPFHEPNGHSKHESNTFYISPDNVAYDGLLLGQDILFPLGGPQRVHVCLMNLPIPRTPKQKEDQKKAQEEHKRKVEENERRKKEQLELAAAARQAAGSSSSQIQR
jgi:hypothetical protein